jgi:hypothetical protein
MPSVNFNKLLANSNNENENENENFLKNVEKSSNYLIRNTYHSDDGIKNKSIKVTKPSLIMFNAIVNQGFQRSNKKLQLGALAETIAETKLPFKKHTYDNNGIAIQVRKITGRYGRLQAAFTITNTYSRTGSNIFNDKIFCLEFLLSLSLGSEVVNATVSLFNNGKMKISGGYLNQHNDNMNNEELFEAQPEMIREYIVDNYTDKEAFLRNDFKFNNVVSEVRFNKGFNLPVISQFSVKSNEYSIRYNPETSSNMFIKFGDFNYVVSQKGVVKIQGIKEYDDIEESYEFILDFVNAMTEFEKGQKPDEKGRIRRALLEIPINYRIKKQHAFDPNKPAPNVTRRGTSCPKNRCPTPYSMQGKCPKEGYYVKPNPQGQPCCYKIPKHIEYSEKKVFAAYKRANVRVPTVVRNVFKFGSNTNTKRNNTTFTNLTNIVVKMNSKVGLKIGSRQCSRYSKVALVDIAYRLGLPVTSTMDRQKLCELIRSVAKNVTNTNNVRGALVVKFTNANKVFVVTGESVNTLKIGGRVAKTIKRDKLVRYAIKLGAKPLETSTVSDLCKMIFGRFVALKPKPPTPVSTPSPVVNTTAELKKYRVTKNLIEEDVRKFLGPLWIEKKGITNTSISKKATELYELVGNALHKNKLNFDKQAIKEFKKVFLRKWKEDTEIEIVQSRYASLPYSMNVIKATQNFAAKRNSEGKFPKHENVLKFASVRAKVSSPPKKKKVTKNWANMSNNNNLPPIPEKLRLRRNQEL